MQIFFAKSLSERFRAGKFFWEETISCFFDQGGFCATTGRGPLGESTGEQLFFSDKNILKLGKNKILFRTIDED